jgi:hypothetical protein
VRAVEAAARASAARVAAAAAAAGAPRGRAAPALVRVPLGTALDAIVEDPPWCGLAAGDRAPSSPPAWALPWAGVSLPTPAGAVRFTPIFLDRGELDRSWAALRAAARSWGLAARGGARLRARLAAERRATALFLGPVGRPPPSHASRPVTDNPEEPPEARELLAELGEGGGLPRAPRAPRAPRVPSALAAVALVAATVTIGAVSCVARGVEAVGDAVDVLATASPVGDLLTPLPRRAPAVATTLAAAAAAAADHNARLAAAAAAHPADAAAGGSWVGVQPAQPRVAKAREPRGREWPLLAPAVPASSPNPPTFDAVGDAVAAGTQVALRFALAATVVAKVNAMLGGGLAVPVQAAPPVVGGADAGLRIPVPGEGEEPARPTTAPRAGDLVHRFNVWLDADAALARPPRVPSWAGDGAGVGLLVVGDVGANAEGGLPWPLPPFQCGDGAELEKL